MFEKYIICPDSLRNTTTDCAVDGFAFDVRLAYYRGLVLSMVEGFEVTVDGHQLDAANLRLGVAGERFSFAELASEAEARWEFTEAATIFAHQLGGLKHGAHEIAVVEILRISYMPQPARRADCKTLQVA
jgi:hypothetical protein